jgi:ribonucleoside-triphosphate reductase
MVGLVFSIYNKEKILKVVKKNQQVSDWDFDKILKAVNKSAKRVSKKLSEPQEQELDIIIKTKLGNRKVVEVSELHEIVESSLEQVDTEIAGSYKSFRNYKQDFVAIWEDLYKKSKGIIYGSDRENANFLSTLISTKGSLVRGYLTKELYRKYYLSKDELKAIDEGFIYLHDLRDLIFGGINCCLFDIARVLEGGFEMSNLHYSEPSSAESALQVIGDIVLAASSQQFGGFTIPEIDKVLIKYCKKTLNKQAQIAKEEGVPDDNICNVVWKRLERELEQGLQSLEMKLNSVPSSRGDFAFTTLSFGCVEDSDDSEIQRLICHKILDTRMFGQKDKAPVVFPKLVYLYSEDQHRTPEQQELFDHVVKCCSVAMYPDVLSLDNGEVGRLYKETGKVVSPMGRHLQVA